MFYWIPPERKETFQKAIAGLAETYSGVTPMYSADMMIAFGRNMSFMYDVRFVEAFEAAKPDEVERAILWRVHTLCWAAKQALKVPGDFVECGVFQGFCSSVLCNYFQFYNIKKDFYLYDTFEGLPEKTSTPEEMRIWNDRYKAFKADHLVNYIRDKFRPYPNVKIVRGMVPDSFKEACPEKISYLHLDMNSEMAELLALEHLFDRVVTGGVIVFDDFGWVCNRKQMESQVAFMHKRNHSILELPTGQGLVIKQP